MINFTSMQQALDFMFDGKKLSVVYLPNDPYRWYFVDEIRNILEFKKDNYEFTKNLIFRDRVIAVLNLGNEQLVCFHTNDGVANNQAGRGGIRQFMIISEPGLFELLRHISVIFDLVN